MRCNWGYKTVQTQFLYRCNGFRLPAKRLLGWELSWSWWVCPAPWHWCLLQAPAGMGGWVLWMCIWERWPMDRQVTASSAWDGTLSIFSSIDTFILDSPGGWELLLIASLPFVGPLLCWDACLGIRYLPACWFFSTQALCQADKYCFFFFFFPWHWLGSWPHLFIYLLIYLLTYLLLLVYLRTAFSCLFPSSCQHGADLPPRRGFSSLRAYSSRILRCPTINSEQG